MAIPYRQALPSGPPFHLPIAILSAIQTHDAFARNAFLNRRIPPSSIYRLEAMTRCIGAAFAVYELKIVLGSILAQHHFELADDRPALPMPRTFTLGPKGGVPLLYCGPTGV